MLRLLDALQKRGPDLLFENDSRFLSGGVLSSQQPRHVAQGHGIRDPRSFGAPHSFPERLLALSRDTMRTHQQAPFLCHGLGTSMERMTRDLLYLGLIV